LSAIGLSVFAQTPTTGRIAGTVRDTSGAVVAGAEITIVSRATGEGGKVFTNKDGDYVKNSLAPGEYQLIIRAKGFKAYPVNHVNVLITQTCRADAQLEIGDVKESVTISSPLQLIERDGPQLGGVVDSRTVSESPLATRNFTQIMGLSPGTAVDLPDNTAVGRNSLDISVNGARATQNSYQINGVDANGIGSNNSLRLAVPAPETILEFKVQTSLYDATFGRSGGGNVQVVTSSGSNDFHGGLYEYFRNNALNANNPFLKAAGVKRPVLNRNVFGGLLGGPIRRDRTFFFISYQGTRELNGASPNSLSSSVLITSTCCLTDDRSEQTLLRDFHPTLSNGQPVKSINPIALALLNTKLPNGQFLIPTPQADGRYSGSAPSTFREDQFNANVDFRLNEQNWLAVKFFLSNAPQTLALFSGPNVAGFGAVLQNNNRVISVQHVRAFGPNVTNEARIGYNFIRGQSVPEEPVADSDVGIQRANAVTFPGLPLIRISPNSGGIAFGTATGNSDLASTTPSATLADTLSISRGEHSVRAGAEIIYYQFNVKSNQNSHGQIDFNNFIGFLAGNVNASVIGNGINFSSLRTTDYSLFIQDDWKLSPKWTLNLGLRYELDLPFYDTRGRISTFDPTLYKPRLDANGNLVVPPLGFVQAGNVIPQYDLPEVPNVSKRVVHSLDPNNFAPRIGFAYAPMESGRVVVRAGYGIYYSRISAFHLLTAIQLPPYYIVGRRASTDDIKPTFADPFYKVPSIDKFPTFVPGINLANQVFDRNLRTPYFHQYNTSLQYSVRSNLLLEIAFVGTRGLNLFRNVGINQAALASEDHPIINQVTGEAITTNSPANAQLRAPFQGASINAFGQRQTTAQSTYNSLQISATRRLTKGLRFLAAYTYAKSVDNASGGVAGTGASSDSSAILGNQLDNRANRGVSDFDRTHRFVLSYLWDLPRPAIAERSTASRVLLTNWQLAGIITAMSGLPIDIVDSNAGSFYLGPNNGLSRPNWKPGTAASTATHNVPAGYFFNPFAFARPVVLAGQTIPSSNGTATADPSCAQASPVCTDFGNVGRNVLRGPNQTNVDFSIIKRFPFGESKNIELRAEFFNLFNHVNLANPISNFNAVPSANISPTNGQIINNSAGDFGRITATSNNPRLIQFVAKLNF
jgi:hypothetical protein